MGLNRRDLVVASSGFLGATVLGTTARSQVAAPPPASPGTRLNVKESPYGATGNGTTDDSAAIQSAIDDAESQGKVVYFPAGHYRARNLSVDDSVFLEGVPGKSVLHLAGIGTPANLLTIDLPSGTAGCTVSGLTFDGREATGGGRVAFNSSGLVQIASSDDVRFVRCAVRNSAREGMRFNSTNGGAVSQCHVHDITETGIRAQNASNLHITDNEIAACGVEATSTGERKGNGIRIFHSSPGVDGAVITGNHIHDIDSDLTLGPYGNGVSLYKAHNVLAANNRIYNCAYSALRANECEATQFVGNNCSCCGETAIWVEATGSSLSADGFAAVVADNVVESAGRGINITNWNNGGRLAVCKGNTLRKIDGVGCYRQYNPTGCPSALKVESQTVVVGNVIEASTPVGIVAGTDNYFAEVIVANNLVRGDGTNLQWGIVVAEASGTTPRALLHGNMLTNLTAPGGTDGTATELNFTCTYIAGVPAHTKSCDNVRV